MKTQIHAENRFKKITGEELSEDVFNLLNWMIVNGHPKMELVLWSKGEKVAFYRFLWKNTSIVAVFNYEISRIISFRRPSDKIFD